MSKTPRSLSGKVAVVTGGARGIGQALSRALAREGVVVAIGDGEDAQRTAEIAREHQLTFAMIPDPDRRISRQYGVNCWPTIVSVNENGFVDFLHSGITHKREVTPDHSRPTAE